MGVLVRDTGNHIFKFLTDHIITQLDKDNKEKRKLKKIIVTMVEHIDSLVNFGALPLIQVPQSFNPSSSDSQQLVKQM